MVVKIAIVGAGPAGTALARILSVSSQKDQFDITIFEGETSIDVRSQGGTLDLRQGTGLDAIRAANLYDEFLKYARFDAQSKYIMDKHMYKYISISGSGDADDKTGRAPEIDRSQLRQILLDSVPEGMVLWGKRLSEVKQDANGETHSLYFRDGSSAKGFDLVIGADGAWSKVRPLLTDEQPFFTGVAGHYFNHSEPEKTVPEIHRLINKGSAFTLGDGRWLGFQQLGSGVLQMSTYHRPADGAQDWAKKTQLDVNDARAVRKFILSNLQGWHPQLREALEKSDPDYIRSADAYMLPVGHKWEHRAGVTMMGDAAHLMSPFAGEGVNQALTDSKILGAALIKAVEPTSGTSTGKSTLTSTSPERRAAMDAAIRKYEKDMFARVEPVAKTTWRNIQYMFSPGMPRYGLESVILNVAEDELPLRWITLPILAVLVYTYFFVIRLWYRPPKE